MLESKFKAKVQKRLETMFPGCVLLPGNANRRQGIPDLIILYKKNWAALEFKMSRTAQHQPNQDWYVAHYGEMSFAAFIYPENEEEVLNELQSAFQPRRTARVSQR